MINEILIKGSIDDLLEGSILDWFSPIEKNVINLNKIKRWGGFSFHNKDIPGLETQSVMEHVSTIIRLIDVVIILIDPYIRTYKHKFLDKILLLRSFEVHDDGKALLKRDIIAPKKTEKDNLNEYIAYIQYLKKLPLIIQDKYEYAFLLQFALKNPVCFPNKAREIMKRIRKIHYFEALTFEAVEKFEYLFYPLKIKNFDGDILANVIRRQLPFYQKYIENNLLPGFREKIFTEKVESWVIEYLKKHPVKILV